MPFAGFSIEKFKSEILIRRAPCIFESFPSCLSLPCPCLETFLNNLLPLDHSPASSLESLDNPFPHPTFHFSILCPVPQQRQKRCGKLHFKVACASSTLPSLLDTDFLPTSRMTCESFMTTLIWPIPAQKCWRWLTRGSGLWFSTVTLLASTAARMDCSCPVLFVTTPYRVRLARQTTHRARNSAPSRAYFVSFSSIYLPSSLSCWPIALHRAREIF